MRIITSAVVKDGGRVYQPGVEHDVDDETGRRFVVLGWATSPDYIPDGLQPPATTTDLAPRSVQHATTVTEV